MVLHGLIILVINLHKELDIFLVVNTRFKLVLLQKRYRHKRQLHLAIHGFTELEYVKIITIDSMVERFMLRKELF